MRFGLLAVLLILPIGCSKSDPATATGAGENASAQKHRGDEQGRGAQRAKPVAATGIVGETPSPGEPLDLGYVPDDAFAVLAFNARRALESKALATLPYDALFAGSLEAWNFDPREVEHWLLFFTPPVEGEPLGTPYSPGAVMRFVRPVDGPKLVATRGATKQVHLGGKPCFVQDVQPGTAFYVADDRTIVFAAEKQLERMLQPKATSQNSLVELIARTSREVDFSLAINVEPIAPLIASYTGASGSQLSPALAPYVRAVSDLSYITATFNLSGDQLLAAQFEARDPEAAQRLHQLARQSGPLVQSGYASLRAQITRNWVAEAAQGLLAVTDSIMARTVITYEPTSIRLDVARPSQLDDLGRRLQTALNRNSVSRQ